MPYVLTDQQRDRYRETSQRSQRRKQALTAGVHVDAEGDEPTGSRLDPNDLMPQIEPHGLTSLSLFAGGGGLDLGFERAGYAHTASFEILDICGETLRGNRPNWQVLSGELDGDVKKAAFSTFRGVDLVHGGPPCQPFSTAGKQAGEGDPRNMWPDFVRCVLQTRPRAFVAENVPGMLDSKFDSFVKNNILAPLSDHYTIFKFKLSANDFGVPQARKRVFFVGFERPAMRPVSNRRCRRMAILQTSLGRCCQEIPRAAAWACQILALTWLRPRCVRVLRGRARQPVSSTARPRLRPGADWASGPMVCSPVVRTLPLSRQKTAITG